MNKDYIVKRLAEAEAALAAITREATAAVAQRQGAVMALKELLAAYDDNVVDIGGPQCRSLPASHAT